MTDTDHRPPPHPLLLQPVAYDHPEARWLYSRVVVLAQFP